MGHFQKTLMAYPFIFRRIIMVILCQQLPTFGVLEMVVPVQWQILLILIINVALIRFYILLVLGIPTEFTFVAIL